MTDISILAPAKINLYLAVTAREENGYHAVETVMQAISLFDTVTVTKTDSAALPISLSCDRAGVPTDTSNLAWRAAELFFGACGESFPIHIHIEKRIPVAGGLAGGSADAAAVFVALNRLSSEVLSREVLLSLGARLGADVPFCILTCLGTYCALGVHYGEVMTPLSCPPPLSVVVASSGEHVSTPWAYQLIDSRPYAPKDACLSLVAALDNGDTPSILARLYNGFENVILPERPGAAHCKALLQSTSADAVMMSGSGPTVIALFADENAAKDGVKAITDAGYSAYLAKTLQ